MPDALVCPKCKNDLIKSNTSWTCKKCNKVFNIESGFINFLGSFNSQCSELPIEEINSLLVNAKKNGWRVAVRDIGFKYPYMNDIFLDNSQGDWLFHCLDLSNTNSCLELGSCWGTSTFYLAKYYNEVWSVDSVKQRLEFQKIKQEQEKIDNIKFCRISSLRLPFKDNYFDLVASRSYLEGMNHDDYSKSPRSLHLDFLKEMRRVLKPNGCLYMGLSNGINFSSFFRKNNYRSLSVNYDRPNENIPNEYNKNNYQKNLMKRNQSELFNYNLYESKRIFKEAGFQNVEIYWTIDHNRPNISGNLDGGSYKYLQKILLNQTDNKLLKSSIFFMYSKLPSSLIKHTLPFISPGFLIFGYKDMKKPTFETKLLREENSFSNFLRRSGSRGIDSKIIYFLFKNNMPYSLVKFPRFKGNDSLISEEEKMRKFNKIDVKRKEIDSVMIFTEPFIKGKIVDYYNLSHSRAVLNWLIDFQQKTQTNYWDFNQLRKKIESLKQILTDIPIEPEIKLRTQEKIRHFLATLQDINLPMVSEHGDFTAANIIIDNQNKVYLMDWEFYNEIGDPLFDFVFFILNSAFDIKPFPQTFLNAFSGKGEYAKILDILISEFCEKKELPVKLIYEAVPYVLLRGIYRTTYVMDRRHFDSGQYVHLLELWDKIEFPRLKK
jgi:ubiquinone/menaquinone biosynthesis C-methylase UbiE/thiamine kinase-like enzyme